MTLIVTAPGPGPITTLESGLKIVRLTEYIGAARGTLTTVADADSPAGTVIKDTQELAPGTTFTSRGTSVNDTAIIPVADLDIGASTIYQGYIGVRVVGRPPVGARAREKWQFQNLPAGPSICSLHDASVFTTYPIPREFYAGYTFLNAGTFSQAFLGATTNWKLRAWGITGGSMEFYVDLLYLVPDMLAATDDFGSFSVDFHPLLLQTGGFGFGPNEDDSTSNSIGTAHSVMPDYYFDSVWDWDAEYDIQDAEYEPSIVDWNGIFSLDLNRESSWIYFRAGSRLANAHTLETDDFSAFSGTTPGIDAFETTEGYIFECGVSNFGSWNLMNSSMQFIGPPGGFFFPPTTQDHSGAAWSVGTHTTRGTAFPGGSSNPQNVAPLLQGFDSLIGLYKVNLMMSHTGADVEMHFGVARWSQVDTAHQVRRGNTAKVIHHADGTHAIALESFSVFGIDSYEVFASPVTVMAGLTPGDSYWVRVEKRFNQYRARCWIDGDTEPTTWDVEGFAPAWVDRTATGAGIPVPVAHPYNTNWPNDVLTIYEDPRYWHGATRNDSAPLQPTPWMHEGLVVFRSGFSTVDYTIQVDEFTLSYDPDIDDTGSSYTGAYFRAEKFDHTVDWGTAYIPPGSWRIVVSDFAPHHFYSDTHGGNVWAWKETGALPLQAAAWQIFSFRRPARGPRWGDITYP